MSSKGGLQLVRQPSRSFVGSTYGSGTYGGDQTYGQLASDPVSATRYRIAPIDPPGSGGTLLPDMTVPMKRGDRLPSLVVQIIGDDGAGLDVTGGTVTFRMVALDADAATPISVEGGCSIVAATTGVVAYDWQAGDLDLPGSYRGEFEVVYSATSRPITVPTEGAIRVVVADDIGPRSMQSVQPGRYDLRLYQGDTYEWQFLLWQDAARTQPLNLTGATVKAEIRRQPGAASVTTLTCTVVLPNKVQVSLPAAQSGSVPQVGYWDLQVTFPGNIVRTMVFGDVTVVEDITA